MKIICCDKRLWNFFSLSRLFLNNAIRVVVRSNRTSKCIKVDYYLINLDFWKSARDDVRSIIRSNLKAENYKNIFLLKLGCYRLLECYMYSDDYRNYVTLCSISSCFCYTSHLYLDDSSSILLSVTDKRAKTASQLNAIHMAIKVAHRRPRPVDKFPTNSNTVS